MLQTDLTETAAILLCIALLIGFVCRCISAWVAMTDGHDSPEQCGGAMILKRRVGKIMIPPLSGVK